MMPYMHAGKLLQPLKENIANQTKKNLKSKRIKITGGKTAYDPKRVLLVVFRYGGQQTKTGNPDKKKSLIFLPKGKSPQTSLPLHHLVLQRVFLNCSLAFEKKDYSNTLCISENELISRHGKKKLEHVTEPDAATKVKHTRSKMARCEHIFE